MFHPNVLRGSLAIVGLMVTATAFGAEPTNTAPAKPAVASTAATGTSICRSRIRPCAARRQANIPRARYFGQGHEGSGQWGQTWGQSTVGQSVGMSAFTAR